MTFCNIQAKLIKTQNDEFYCDRCAYNNTPVDCMDNVPCNIGWYYKAIPPQQKRKRLKGKESAWMRLSAKTIKTDVRYRKSTKEFVAYKSGKILARFPHLHDAQAYLINYTVDEALRRLNSRVSKIVNANGRAVYSFSFLSTDLVETKDEERTRQECRELIERYREQELGRLSWK